MIIESHDASPTTADAPVRPTGPVVALLGPAITESTLPDKLRQSGALPVPLPSPRSPEEGAAALVAALGCDLVVAELPAPVGLDAHTPRIWELLGLAGLPRVVVVSGLGAATADFDDIAAIAQRLLGEDCVPVRLPVFDDDGDAPVASLDLTRGVLDTRQGQIATESAHLRVAAGDLSALLSVMAATVPDDTAAEEYVALLEEYSDEPQPADMTATTPILLGMPSRADAAVVPARLAPDVAGTVAEGLLAPIVADTADGAWVNDVRAWGDVGGTPADRLVRRDADGEPTDGWAGVVLAVVGETALIRPIYGDPADGYALITAVGSDESGAPVPLRAWPTELRGIGRHDADSGQPRWWATTVRMSVGDTVAGGQVWLVPAELG